MTIKEQIEFLRAHSSQTPSKWKDKAEWRRNNKEFLEKIRKMSIQEEMKRRGQ